MGELKKAIKVGIPNNKIVYSGVGNSKEEIIYALKRDIEQFNVESVEPESVPPIITLPSNCAIVTLCVSPFTSMIGIPDISPTVKTEFAQQGPHLQLIGCKFQPIRINLNHVE